MKEIGGYLEMELNKGPMLCENGIRLNCGRNALAYLLTAKDISKIWLPYFLCDSVINVCKKYGVEIGSYHIDEQWLPKDVNLKCSDWLYIVNYYGQIGTNILLDLADKYKRVIVDNAQAYFDAPLKGIDTIYTCRKFFGVSDGAVLFSNGDIKENISADESFNRMRFVLGRFERNAGEFYEEASKNNDFFDNEPIKWMSKLTENLLRGIDYQFVKNKRTANFAFLHERLGVLNKLKVKLVQGAFMYPFMVENASEVKKELLEHKIYIPTLWPNVVRDLPHDWWEWHLANNVLPLPCDQRYGLEEMQFMTEFLLKYTRGEKA